MKKKKLLPLVFCILLLFLLLVVYFILRNHNEEAEKAENEASVIQVLNVVADDITSISFTVAGQEETFTLTDDVWKLEGDDAFEVNEDEIDNLISSITGMTADRKLEEVADIGEYGLDQPVQTAVLTDKDGNTYTVYWGNSNASTSDDYIYINDQTDIVYTVSYSVLESFCETLEDYRKQEEDSSVDSTADAEEASVDEAQEDTENTSENDTESENASENDIENTETVSEDDMESTEGTDGN